MARPFIFLEKIWLEGSFSVTKKCYGDASDSTELLFDPGHFRIGVKKVIHCPSVLHAITIT